MKKPKFDRIPEAELAAAVEDTRKRFIAELRRAYNKCALEDGVRHSEIARRMRTSTAQLVRLLGDQSPLDLRAISSMATGLGVRLEVKVVPRRG